MTIARQILRSAARGADSLPQRRDALLGFLHGRLTDNGGFADRAGRSDLYYTHFGLQCLLALNEPAPTRLCRYVRSFAGGRGLDLVHLACLARCRALLEPHEHGPARQEMLARAAEFRSADGGFADSPGQRLGQVYASFLGLGLYQDTCCPLPNPAGLAACIRACRVGGGYAGGPGAHVRLAGNVAPVTAAAVVALRAIGEPVEPSTPAWLRSLAGKTGGFLAAPSAPMPDLLSTATVLHALAQCEIPDADLETIRPACRRYVLGLWCDCGGFHGHAFDDQCDCEYAFYALLALGHLA